MYTLYALNKQSFALTKIEEGLIGPLRRKMNFLRHSAPKDHKYLIYRGNDFVTGTNN